jgi:serine protease Do
MKGEVFLAFFMLWIICLPSGNCFGKTYKYQDGAGNWHFTDSPERIPKDAQKLKGTGPTDSEIKDLKKQLYDKFSPRNDIEKATLGTVTIKSPVGLGSGFFITEDGYIVTNKHVIRLDDQKKEGASKHFEKVDKMADEISQRLAAEETRLEAMRESLEKLKRVAGEERNRSMRILLENKYKTDREMLERMEEDFKNRKKEFLDKKENYEREKRDFFWKTSDADRSLSFTIVLKDQSEFKVYLVAISQEMDLALLKLDGYKTPYLRPGNSDQVFQGEKVYAIGSPAGLRDSVSAGVISGYDGYFLRTDAKIYPGNSGGPLINQKGQVIGINTLKAITHQFEGLGFAIKMNAVAREFGGLAKVRYDE